eukprot:TRINITY_DN2650_c0_g1_i1.p1 TRINITY_DN2650_c0_g1~~TRINITY_DN2650_c0_g1_i1.p1  ORF type:complete len:813 (+),score=181.13 TRINITY_DN2650_c0_g1_i1:36-2474(+)
MKLLVVLFQLAAVITMGAELPSFTYKVVDSNSMNDFYPPTTCSGASSASAVIDRVFMGQTHLMTPKDNPFFHLANDRAALLKVNVRGTTSGIASPEVSVVGAWSDKDSQTLCLAGPAELPTSFNYTQQSATDSFVVTLPRTWITAQLTTITISIKGSDSTITYTAEELGINGRLHPFQFMTADMLFFEYTTPTAKPTNFHSEYFAMMPFSLVNFTEFPVTIKLPTVVIGPSGYSSKAQVASGYKCDGGCPYDGFALISAARDIVGILRNANGMTNYAHAYGCMTGPAAGGLGGGSTGSGVGYTGVFFHEMGHAMDLGHAGDEYAAKKYPYPGFYKTGGGVGETWGYEQDTGYFVPTLTERGTAVEKQDPMQGGDGAQRNGRIYTMFSDFNARRIFDHIVGATNAESGVEKTLPDTMGANAGRTYKLFQSGGRSHWKDDVTPAADGSKFVNWQDGKYVATPYSYSFPVYQNIPVFTVYGSYSSVEPKARVWHETLNYKGNYVRLVQPEDPEDWKYVLNTNYCYWACDFILRVTYANGTQVNHLMGNDVARKSGWKDPASGNSFFRFGANFLDIGEDIVLTQLFYRPLSKSQSPHPNTFANATQLYAAAELLMEDKTVVKSVTGSCVEYGCKYSELVTCTADLGSPSRYCTCPTGHFVVGTESEEMTVPGETAFPGCEGICPDLEDVAHLIEHRPQIIQNYLLLSVPALESATVVLSELEDNVLSFDMELKDGEVADEDFEDALISFLADFFCKDEGEIELTLNTTATPIRSSSKFPLRVVPAPGEDDGEGTSSAISASVVTFIAVLAGLLGLL